MEATPKEAFTLAASLILESADHFEKSEHVDHIILSLDHREARIALLAAVGIGAMMIRRDEAEGNDLSMRSLVEGTRRKSSAV